MTSENHILQMAGVLVADAAEDYVGLWQLVNRTTSVLGSEDEASVINNTLLLVRELLSRGLVAGDLEESGGFAAWANQSTDYVVSRIESEWKVIGGPPDIGDICWFDWPESS